MLAGIQCHNGAGCVLGVPGADADSVDLRQFTQHLGFIGVQTSDAELFAHHFQTLFIDIAECVQLNIRVEGITVDVGKGDIAHADNCDFDFAH